MINRVFAERKHAFKQALVSTKRSLQGEQGRGPLAERERPEPNTVFLALVYHGVLEQVCGDAFRDPAGRVAAECTWCNKLRIVMNQPGKASRDMVFVVKGLMESFSSRVDIDGVGANCSATGATRLRRDRGDDDAPPGGYRQSGLRSDVRTKRSEAPGTPGEAGEGQTQSEARNEPSEALRTPGEAGNWASEAAGTPVEAGGGAE